MLSFYSTDQGFVANLRSMREIICNHVCSLNTTCVTVIQTSVRTPHVGSNIRVLPGGEWIGIYITGKGETRIPIHEIARVDLNFD